MSGPKSAIIVGGGLVGLLTAAELLRRGLQVTVFDSGEFAQQASWAGGGILSPLAPWDEPRGITELAALSVPLTKAWVIEIAANHGPDCEYWVSGLRVVGETERAVPWLDTHSMRYRVDGDAVELPDVAQLRTPRYGKRILAWLLENGASLRRNDEVMGVSAHAVRIAGGSVLEADVVCVCAGPWSTRIAGVGLPDDVIAPVRGQMLLLARGEGSPGQIIRCGGTYVIPRRDGRVLVGSTLEQTGFDARTTEHAREMLRSAAIALWPSLGKREIERQWAGLRPASSTGVPLVGCVLDTGVWVNTGHYRNGVTLAAGSAALLADAMFQKARPTWASAFDPDGFTACPRARHEDVNPKVNSISSAG